MMWSHDEIRQSRKAMVAAIIDAGGEVMANGNCRCPFHDDRSPSASIKLVDRGHWHFHCFPCNWGGDVYDVIRRYRSCTLMEAKNVAHTMVGSSLPEPSKPPKPARVFITPEVAAESYARWKGGAVERYYKWSPDWLRARIKLPNGKTFLELTRCPGGWQQKAPAKPHCLYRVGELKPTEIVAVCEGEKAADAAWSVGMQAVTSGSSSSAASADWSPLAGRTVVIYPDNDEPGRRYALDVAGILLRLSDPPKIGIVSLPGLPDGGDMADYVAARGAK